MEGDGLAESTRATWETLKKYYVPTLRDLSVAADPCRVSVGGANDLAIHLE